MFLKGSFLREVYVVVIFYYLNNGTLLESYY